MSNASDFVVENGVLTKYKGTGGDVVIPDGVTEIGHSAFVQSTWQGRFLYTHGCHGLISVLIPDSVTSIGMWAFSGCENLTTVIMPDSVAQIGKGAFEDCNRLKKVVLPASAAGSVSSAFPYSDDLRILTPNLSALPAKFRICAALCFAEDGGSKSDPRFESHGKYIKTNSGKLVEVAAQNRSLLSLLCREKWIGAKDIEVYVETVQKTGNTEMIAMILDYQNSKLSTSQKMNVEKRKEAEENTVFDRMIARANKTGIAGLNFVFAGNLWTFPSRKELKAFVESKGAKLSNAISAKTDYLVLNDIHFNSEKAEQAEALGIEIITELQFNEKAGRAFGIEYGTLVKYRGVGGHVEIPDNVRAIDSEVFRNRLNLVSVVIPETVSKIGHSAFNGCENLTSITIPDSVKFIGSYVFEGCTQLEICGESGSYAEAYAKENSIPFVAE